MVKLRWAFSNRVVAAEVTANEVGMFRSGDFLTVRGQLMRVWNIDSRRLVLRVY